MTQVYDKLMKKVQVDTNRILLNLIIFLFSRANGETLNIF